MKRVIPLLLILSYWALLVLLKGLRTDHLILGATLLILAYSGTSAKKLLGFLLPYLLTVIIYDSQRFYSDWIRGRIHVRLAYDFDKRFFGIRTAGGILTPNEWCQLHTSALLDLTTGFAYLVFFVSFIAFAAYFQFWVSRKGTGKWRGPEVAQRAKPMGWAFLALNLVGYSTYYWFPSAPPWYVSQYGFGPAKLQVRASPAGCLRADHILGTHVFQQMYGRAADVFGSIPCLHIAYPLLAVIFAFHLGAGRTVATAFFFLMCFSAVYLNHHFVLDILWGMIYALVIGWVSMRTAELRK